MSTAFAEPNATVDDATEYVRFLAAIEEGRVQLDVGLWIEHDEVRRQHDRNTSGSRPCSYEQLAKQGSSLKEPLGIWSLPPNPWVCRVFWKK